MEEVTFVITSCGRPDLLRETIDSFLNTNRYPIAKYVLIEDSANDKMQGFVRQRYGNSFHSLILNDPKLGQIRSIDRAYAEVETPYVFHCEDDWRFLKGGFIEHSFALLAEDRKIINVWLRGMECTNGHPIEPGRIESSGGLAYRRMALDKKGPSYQGFTFNPTLKRLADYEIVKPYRDLGSEGAIAQRLRELEFYAVTLEEAYVQHIGGGRHVPLPGDKLSRTLKHKLRNFLYRRLYGLHS